jgi:ABC-type uncharacterized transport system ATPase subunit
VSAGRLSSRTAELLERTGLGEARTMALLHEPELLILDEPPPASTR